jgi:pimeloyl-ACP methyl ester carboxylesterase
MSLNTTVFPDLGVPTIAPEFNAYAPDRPGMDPYVAEADRVLDVPVWREADQRVIVGHSFGGMLALAWLLARPEAARRVHGLVLIGTTAGPMFDDVRLRVLSAGGREWRIGVGSLLPVWNSIPVTRSMQRLVNRGTLATHTVDFRRLRWRGDLAVGLAGWHATAWEARRAFRGAMAGFDVRERLKDIAVPAIVLHGAHDCYFTEGTARTLVSGLGQGELRLLADAGHMLPLTHGDAVLAAVRDLLARAAQPASSLPAAFSSS